MKIGHYFFTKILIFESSCSNVFANNGMFEILKVFEFLKKHKTIENPKETGNMKKVKLTA